MNLVEKAQTAALKAEVVAVSMWEKVVVFCKAMWKKMVEFFKKG